ncbi:hypothetical protein [Streptomyces sp. NPDC091259]|uniref:hypothetical protein n=1 Tax=Streptomyces sp. NPDC091259 TaxID=3365976 RepID=UPI003829157B
MSRTTRFIAVAGLAALLSAGAATAASAAPVTGPGVIGWDSAGAVAAGSTVIGWDSATADKRVIGWD